MSVQKKGAKPQLEKKPRQSEEVQATGPEEEVSSPNVQPLAHPGQRQDPPD